MAIIHQLLTEAQILGMKGEVDFYYQRGRTVCRSWPKKRTVPPTAAELANQSFFGRVQNKIKRMSEPNRGQWRDFVRGTNIVWTDAIRFFNLSDNPDRELLPNFYFDSINATHFADMGWWLMTVKFKRDDIESDYGSCIIANLSNEPFNEVVWQSVGRKRRRRAILSDMFRPQFSGYIYPVDIHVSPEPDEAWAQFFTTWRNDYIQFCAVPKSNKDPKRMQTPIFTRKLEWIEA